MARRLEFLGGGVKAGRMTATTSPNEVRPAGWRIKPAPLWAAAGIMGLFGAGLVAFKLGAQPLWIDFLTMWTGGRLAGDSPGALYDFAADDRAQAWLLGAAAHDRPFPYPPSSLLIFGPLGRLPFWVAGAIWAAITLAAFVTVLTAILPPRRRALGIALTLLSPAAVWAMISGQCVFLLGALAIGAMARVERRPILAGSLLGMAAAFKPSVLLMAPVALAAGGHGRALFGAALGALFLTAGSVGFYGLQPWLAWISVAPSYLSHMINDPKFYSSIIGPSGLAAQLGVTGWTLALWRIAFIVIGLVVTALVFRRSRDFGLRLTALFGGSLLVSPYAMNYESVLLAPGAVMALMAPNARRQALLSTAAFLALMVAGLPNIGAISLLLFLGLALGSSNQVNLPFSRTLRSSKAEGR